MKKLFLLLYLFCSICHAGIQELYLRKIAFNFTGEPPAEQDFLAVSKMDEQQFLIFLKKKTHLYIKNENFISKIENAMADLLDLPKLSIRSEGEESFVFSKKSVFKNFIQDFVKNEKPWSFLFTSNKYRISVSANDYLSDLDFYQNIFKTEKYRNAKLSSDIFLNASEAFQKENLLGILSTPDFFLAHSASIQNPGCSKAQVFLKNVLCQDIEQNVALPEKTPRDEICAGFSPEVGQATKLFQNSLTRPLKFPTRMLKLSLFDSLIKKNITILGANPAHFMSNVIQTDLYSHCQANYLFKKFIDPHLLLNSYDSVKSNSLVKKFKNSFSDFLADAVDAGFEKFKAQSVPKLRIDALDFISFIKKSSNNDLQSVQNCFLSYKTYDVENLTGSTTITAKLKYIQFLNSCSSNLRNLKMNILSVSVPFSNWAKAEENIKLQFTRDVLTKTLGFNLYPPEHYDELSLKIIKSLNFLLQSQKKETDLTYIANAAASYSILTEEFWSL